MTHTEGVFRDYWEGDDGLEQMVRDFSIAPEDIKGAEFFLASYTYEDYEGRAFVLFRRDGKLWEVHGSHCSCYGLEGQWDPEETTMEALEKRNFAYESWGTALREALQRLGADG